MPRWQATYSRGEAVRWISHLDLLRAWERTFRRAGLRLTRSQGFRPHPRMALAAPLPVGILGRAELLDVDIEDELTAGRTGDLLSANLPNGLDLRALESLAGPPLAARVCQAAYTASFPEGCCPPDLNGRIANLLAEQALPRERRREKGLQRYDLRPLISDLWVERLDSGIGIGMRLEITARGAGRADEVLAALGLFSAAALIERTELVLRPIEDGS